VLAGASKSDDLAAAAARLSAELVAVGVLVVFHQDRLGFAALQRRAGRTRCGAAEAARAASAPCDPLRRRVSLRLARGLAPDLVVGGAELFRQGTVDQGVSSGHV
jgi:hypothetical protein